MREARYKFNPCLFQDRIYLFGCGAHIIEAFSPQSDEFLSLSLAFVASGTSGCFAYASSHFLVLHSDAVMRKYAGSSGQLVKHMEQKADQICVDANCQLAVDSARRLLFVVDGDCVKRISMETGRYTSN